MGAIFAVAANNVPGGLIDFFHGIQVAIMLALMTNIIQFAWWKVKNKKNVSHCQKYGPVYILILSMFLVLIQPVCMLVIGSWACTDDDAQTFCIENFFFDGGKTTNALTPNTTIGWCIQIFGTYLGFLFLFVGVFWATQLHVKIAKKWSVLRNAVSGNR